MLHAKWCSMSALMLLCCIWRSFRIQSCIGMSDDSHDVSIQMGGHTFGKVSIRMSAQWCLLSRTSQLITLCLLMVMICRSLSMYVSLPAITFSCFMS